MLLLTKSFESSSLENPLSSLELGPWTNGFSGFSYLPEKYQYAVPARAKSPASKAGPLIGSLSLSPSSSFIFFRNNRNKFYVIKKKDQDN